MLTPAETVVLLALSVCVVSAPTALTLVARKVRARRRRPSPFPRGTEVRLRPGVAVVPSFEPFDWDDEDAVIEGEILRDHGHDTVLMEALRLADRECDDTRVLPLPVQRRGGVR